MRGRWLSRSKRARPGYDSGAWAQTYVDKLEIKMNSPTETLRLALLNERAGNHETAASLYEEYSKARPSLSTLFSNSIARCKAKPQGKSQAKIPLITIITPTYNSKNTIVECVKSVLNQSLREIEVIVVDDGSTDGTPRILREQLGDDQRLKIIRSPHPSGSAGIPRNTGLKIATGKYIGFVDSDDYVGQNYFDSLVSVAESDNSDIVISSGFYNLMSNGEIQPRNYGPEQAINSKSDSMATTHSSSMIWDKIYKREFLASNAITLGEGPAAVDVPFTIKSYFLCRKSSTSKTVEYYYRRESPNSVTVRFRKNTNCDFELKAYRDILEWARMANLSKIHFNYINMKQLTSYIYTCKLVNPAFLHEYFTKCCAALRPVNSKSLKQSLRENKLSYLASDLDIFTKSDIVGFVKKYREHESYMVNADIDSLFPKTVIRSNIIGECGLAFLPDWSRSNSYQRDFYQPLSKKNNMDIFGLHDNQVKLDFIARLLGPYNRKILHIHWIHPYLDEFSAFENLIVSLKQKGFLIIWTVHNLFSHEPKDIDHEKNARARLAGLADNIICHSSAAKTLIAKSYQCEESKIETIPHGKYNIASLYPKKIVLNPATISSDFRLKLLIAGEVRAYKNHRWAIEILNQYNRECPVDRRIELTVAGRASREDADWLTATCRDNQWFRAIPRRLSDEDLTLEVLRSHMLFIPYDNVLTSGVALLAVSHGRPFLAKDLPQFAEIGGASCKHLFANDLVLMDALHQLTSLQKNGEFDRRFNVESIQCETKHLDWESIACSIETQKIFMSNITSDPRSTKHIEP